MDLIKFIVPILISILSLIFSIVTYESNRRFEKAKKKYDAISPAYMDYVIKEIPLKFSRLSFKSTKDESIDEFVESLQKMRLKIKVIQIIDSETYKNWSNQLMNIEDFVIEKGNDHFDDEHEIKILNDVRLKLSHLYKDILSEDYKKILN